MAVRHGYGKIAGADALVFAYDTGDTVNSYKGEPTENIAQTLSTFGTDGSGQSAVGTYTQVDGNNNHYKIVDVASNTRVSRTYSNFTAGASYTFSVEFRKLTGTPTLRFQLQGRNSGSIVNVVFPTTAQIGIVDVDGWQRATYTFTPGATSTTLYWFIQDGDDYTSYTHSYELRNPQLEQKSHATPFVNGTRSATEGLKDLTGNTSIDLTNAGFNSNAELDLDGSSDYLESITNLGPLTDLQEGTIELVFRWDGGDIAALLHLQAGSSYYGTLIGVGNWTGSTDNESIFLYVYNSSGQNLGVTNYKDGHFKYRDGEYHHLVFTESTSNGSLIFIDGVQVATSGQISTFTSGTVTKLQIGKRAYDASGAHLNGAVPVAKIYNRALTAAEVKNNYRHYKNRFGI